MCMKKIQFWSKGYAKSFASHQYGRSFIIDVNIQNDV